MAAPDSQIMATIRQGGQDCREMAVRAAAQDNPRLMPTPEACEEFMGFPRGWTDLGNEGPEAAAYARILRGVQGIPGWRERLRAMGNAVVPLMPMLLGCFIWGYESRAETKNPWDFPMVQGHTP